MPLLDSDTVENKRRDQAVIIPLVQKYLKPGSIIMSDSWSAYSSLTAESYKHYSVNHNEHFVDPERPEIHTHISEIPLSKLTIIPIVFVAQDFKIDFNQIWVCRNQI